MFDIVIIICGISMIISAILTKKNPQKALASKARQRKKNLSDEQYITNVFRSNIIAGILFLVIEGIWFIAM